MVPVRDGFDASSSVLLGSSVGGPMPFKRSLFAASVCALTYHMASVYATSSVQSEVLRVVFSTPIWWQQGRRAEDPSVPGQRRSKTGYVSLFGGHVVLHGVAYSIFVSRYPVCVPFNFCGTVVIFILCATLCCNVLYCMMGFYPTIFGI